MSLESQEHLSKRTPAPSIPSVPPQRRELVGRQRELTMLAPALDRLDAGSAGVVQIVGEPGIGKTSLLAEVVARAQERDHLALVGRAAEFERDLPFGIIVDALDDHLASLDIARSHSLDADRLAELAAIFPSLTQSESERLGGLQNERYRSYRTMRLLLTRLAAERPLVLGLDDLHWADAASIELVSHLLRRQPDGPVLLLLAYRPRQLPPRLETVLEGALRDGLGQRIELAPLGADDSDALLGDEIDRTVRERLYRESGGNPFYLQQLARAVHYGGRRTHVGDQLDDYEVPRAVKASIIDELNMLTARARMILQAAAVVGEPFEPDIVADVAEVDEADALIAFDEVLGLDLIRPTAAPRRFLFRHPIVRRAVYESISGGWRLAAHGRAARGLAARGAPAAARAHHVERAASVGDQEAIELLTDAGHATVARAPATAAGWFKAALRLLPERAENVPERLELLTPMAIALGSAGHLEESREALHEVLHLLPPEPTPLRVRAVAFSAIVHRLLGDLDEAQRLLHEALSKLPDHSSSQAAELKIELASGYFFEGDWETMETQAREVLQQRVPDQAVNALAASILALARYVSGKIPRTEASIAEAAHLVDELPDSDLATRLAAAAFLGWAELCTERVDEAIRHTERGVAVSRATGQGHLVGAMLAVQAMGLISHGRLAEAMEVTEAAVESSLLSANSLFLAWGLMLRGLLKGQLGDSAEAVRLGEQAVAAGGPPCTPMSAIPHWYLAEALLEAGQAERCRDQLLDPDGEAKLPLFPLFETRCYETLVRTELALGRVSAAECWAAQAESTAGRLGLKSHIAEAQRARAAVLLASGNAASAARAALASAAAADTAGVPIEAGRARILAGTALAAAGDRDRAVTQLEKAKAELDSRGAVRYRDQAARELRRLGRRVPRAGRRGRASTGVEALSGREREVAELATAGKTNRQIAAALVLSEKTIESHLSNIFAKLEVTSRAEVAAAIQRARDDAAS